MTSEDSCTFGVPQGLDKGVDTSSTGHDAAADTPEEDNLRIAPSLHRLGEDRVGCYLLEEAGAVTIIDAGLPGYDGELTAELAAMGRTIEDVRALVLTHGHSDHIGFAERVRDEHGVPVSVHELDAGYRQRRRCGRNHPRRGHRTPPTRLGPPG